ncbi:thermopsin family protease [Sulfurisphaera tokodaii]|uniref:A5 family peptidase n=2 Tax=Sulfurisphaera tokodaii TaxID=111955 RepID=Q96YG4_SULTO|nr:thermopsin family protease [Sulfurisphaera tokodaii]BAB67313.1 putative A5 family peptidase [Sulfurisphaera tokodaii str. 7]HII73058.1 thermopsin family protease [Sulfurisphaera tokodaii]
MKILAIFLIIFLAITPLITLSLSSSAFTVSYPMGMSFYSLFSTYFTTEVMGVINITSMNIGSSYLPNGQYLTTGNASLQLNAMIDGLYWAQDVILFHQISNNEFKATLVLNLWNLTGPFTIPVNGSVTTYQGLGVICYQGPSFIVTLPTSIVLFMIDNSTLYFGYNIDNKSGIFYKIPLSGEFEIGGLSIAGIPNDVEFVFGGPGGGSVVDMQVEGTMNIYFMQSGKLSLVPYAYSIGFDTAESVVGVRSLANLTNLWKPNTILSSGSDDAIVLWPVKPEISTLQRNSTVYVNISFNGKPLSNQKIVIEDLGLTGLVPISVNYTNDSGYVVFNNISSPLYVVYYPGNFTLSSDYIVSSPIINSILTHVKSIYDSMVSFLKSYNFKKSISSFFNNIHSATYSESTSVNYLILIYILGFSVGIVISALLIRFKL